MKKLFRPFIALYSDVKDQEKKNEMEKRGFDEVRLDSGQMRIYATSYFVIFIHALRHAVTIHTIMGWQCMVEIAQVFCIHVCV